MQQLATKAKGFFFLFFHFFKFFYWPGREPKQQRERRIDKCATTFSFSFLYFTKKTFKAGPKQLRRVVEELMGPVKRAEPATNCRWIDADRKRKRESNGVGRTRLMGPRQTLLPAAASSRSAAAQEHPPSSSSCKTRFLSLTLIIRVLTFKGGLSLSSSSSSSSSSTPSL